VNYHPGIRNSDPEVLFADCISNSSLLQENPQHQIIKAQKSHIIVNKQRPRILPLIIILFIGVLFLSLIVTAIANAENITLSDPGTSLRPTLTIERGGSGNSTGTVIFFLFYNHNCHECQRVLGFLPGFLKEHPDAAFISYDIANNSEFSNLFQQYNDRFGRPSSPVPAIFVGQQELVGYEEITSGLGTGIAAARANGTTFPITPIPTVLQVMGQRLSMVQLTRPTPSIPLSLLLQP
jgi:thiol-disulfide isomerase/thioredoxin